MALTSKRKAELALMNLPGDIETRERARLFQQRSGLTSQEFSEAIGYGTSSLRVYLASNYGNTLTENHDGSRYTLNIRAALKEYMDRWEEVQTQPSARPLYQTEDLQRITTGCLRALELGSAYVIDGPPATQKTASLRAVERLVRERNDGSRALYLYARINHAPQGFLRTLCNEAGVPNRGTIDQLILKLRHFLCKGRTLLMVDEANNLPADTLDILRQLLDLPPYFGVVLAGSDDLSARLRHWKMERWHSRVRKTLLVDGPSQKEARAILRAELGPLIGEISDAECDADIAQCRVTGMRTATVDGKTAARQFSYISARKLFWAIDRAREVVTTQSTAKQEPTAQKESAA